MSPHQYLLSERIDRAKQLLTNTQLSISDISYQLGFASKSHFTQHFGDLLQSPRTCIAKKSGQVFDKLGNEVGSPSLIQLIW